MFKPLRRYIFSIITVYYRQAFAVADYIANDMKAKDMRFACIYQDDQSGRSGLQGFKEAAKLYGAKWVGETFHKRKQLDFTSQILTLKKAGANYVFLSSTPRPAAQILIQANKLDWHPQFFGGDACIDKKVIELSGEAAKGYMGCGIVTYWHEDAPGLAKMRKAVMKYHRTLEGILSTHSILGWVGAMLISEGLKRAGRNLTRDGLVDALETIRDFDPDGLMPPITWGPNRREGGIGTRIVKVNFEKKVPVPVTGWRIPKY